ncbi:hypothetical protein [Methanobacterium sp. ACI-7]|uniref:hypothetical protein n=1 Tax=unclassified Methanobacterium TaxID=2627676 RepID=UPI0039C43E01
MNKLTVGLIIILVMAVGVGGFLLGTQNNQGVPITLTNNSTDDSSYSNTNIKSSKNATKQTNSTVKKNTTNSTTNSTKKTNTTNSTT